LSSEDFIFLCAQKCCILVVWRCYINFFVISLGNWNNKWEYNKFRGLLQIKECRLFYLMVPGNLAVTIIKGPLEAVAGVLYGIILGVVAWYIPHRNHVSTW